MIAIVVGLIVAVAFNAVSGGNPGVGLVVGFGVGVAVYTSMKND